MTPTNDDLKGDLLSLYEVTGMLVDCVDKLNLMVSIIIQKHLKEPLKEDTTSNSNPPIPGPTGKASPTPTRPLGAPQGTKSPGGVEKTVGGTQSVPQKGNDNSTPPPSPSSKVLKDYDGTWKDIQTKGGLRYRWFSDSDLCDTCPRNKNCKNAQQGCSCLGWLSLDYKPKQRKVKGA